MGLAALDRLIKEITLVDEKYNIRNNIILAAVSLEVEINKKNKKSIIEGMNERLWKIKSLLYYI